MAGEFIEFFEELLFGSGAWLGLLIILSIAFIVSYRVPFSAIIFAVILFFLTLEYLNEISVNSNFMWATVISMLSGFLLMGSFFFQIKKGG